MNKCKVSVIIPVYNMCSYIGQCLDSVVNQTLEDIEIICIDDGSSDGTIDVLEEYAAQYPFIHIIRQDRMGPGAARNVGIHVCAGEFMAFMDADDYYLSEDALETLYLGAKNSKKKAAAGRIYSFIDGKIRKKDRMVSRRMYFEKDEVIEFYDYQYCSGYQAFIFEVDLIRKCHIVFPDYVRFEDPVFLVEALTKIKSFWVTTKPIYVYRRAYKDVSYENTRVVTDMVRGIRDIVLLSQKYDYRRLLKDLRGAFATCKYYYFIHIVKGNMKLWQLLQEMDAVYKRMGIVFEGYYLDYSREKISEELAEFGQWEKDILSDIEQKSGYIIYGAGIVARTVYRYLRKNSDTEFMGFAVTEERPDACLFNHTIKCIKTFTGMKKRASVIIAAKEPNNSEMKKTAEELGFTNCICVDREMVGVDNFQISDEEFTV